MNQLTSQPALSHLLINFSLILSAQISSVVQSSLRWPIVILLAMAYEFPVSIKTRGSDPMYATADDTSSKQQKNNGLMITESLRAITKKLIPPLWYCRVY